LPEEHKTCVYRVVQEALNNCAQHAQASAVQVAVRYQGGRQQACQILVTVQDDGSGFDPERVRGLGLLGMEERVRHLGGTFQIESSPGRGTLLRVALPLAAIPGTSKRQDVLPARSELETPELETQEVVWDGGLAAGTDSHTAG